MFEKKVVIRRFELAGWLAIMFMIAVSSVGRVVYAEGSEQPLVLGSNDSAKTSPGDNTIVDDHNGEITLAPNSPILDEAEGDDNFAALASRS